MTTDSAQNGHVAEAVPPGPIFDYSTPAEQDNIMLVQGLYKELINGRNGSLTSAYFSEDFVQHNPLFGEGRDGFREFVEKFFFSTFPDLRVSTEIAVAQNDRVVSLTKWEGHAPDQDEELAVEIADLYRIRDGKLIEHWDVVGYPELEAFGITRPEHSQPDTPVDREGTPTQRENLDRFLTYSSEITIQDTSRAELYIAEDFIQHDPMIAPGLEGFRQCCQIFGTLAPDMAVITHHVVVGKDHVSAIWDWNGHQAGTGGDFILPGADVYRMREGMLTEHWDVMDYTFVKASLGFHPKTVFMQA
jgi:predicted SnoaL-like aldol condensation-catalyzing enzyme